MSAEWLYEPCDACDGTGIESDPSEIDILWPDYRCHVCSGRGIVRSTDFDDFDDEPLVTA